MEIPVDQAFDREAYAKVTLISSQPSQATQLSQPSQPSRSSYAPVSQLRTPTGRPFLWDEEDDEVPIIPDSQELPGSSSYYPTQTPRSITGITTRPNTGTNTDADFATRRSSARIGFHSDPPSFPSRSSIRGKSQPNSSQGDSSVQPSTDTRYLSTSVEEPSEDRSLPQPGVSESVEDPISFANSRLRSEAPASSGSSQLPSSLENHPPSLARGTWSQEAADISGRVPARQRSSQEVDDSSQLQFQTQLSAATGDDAQRYVVTSLKAHQAPFSLLSGNSESFQRKNRILFHPQ